MNPADVSICRCGATIHYAGQLSAFCPNCHQLNARSGKEKYEKPVANPRFG